MRAPSIHDMTDSELYEKLREVTGELAVRICRKLLGGNPPQEAPADAPIYLNQAEVCGLLEITDNTLRGWITRGIWPAGTKHGRCKRWTESEVFQARKKIERESPWLLSSDSETA